MPFTAQDVFQRTTVILNDAGGVRWTLPTQLNFLNDCFVEIAAVAPEVLSKMVVLSLVAGARQSLPANAAQLLRVISNVTGTDPNWVDGLAVTAVPKHVMDATNPNWMATAGITHSVNVAHVIADPDLGTDFYVVPGNTGTGKLRVQVAELPPRIATPANSLVLSSYSATVPLHDRYQNAVIDYVLFKAFSTDGATPGGAQRAQAHYQMFMMALGATQAKEMAVSPNRGDPHFQKQ